MEESALKTIEVPNLDLSMYDDMPENINVRIADAGLDVGSMFKVPRFSGDGLIGVSPPNWVCAATKPATAFSEITGTIVNYKQFRAYYHGKFSKGARPPTCASIDLENGISNPDARKRLGVGGKCYECPFNFFGQGSCGRRLAVFMFSDQVEGPIVLDLPPTSVKPIADELEEMEKVIPVTSAFRVKVGFASHTTKSGQEMWRASLTPIAVLDQETLNNIAALTKAQAEEFKIVPSVSNDPQRTEPGSTPEQRQQRQQRQQRVAGEVIDTMDVDPSDTKEMTELDAPFEWDD